MYICKCCLLFYTLKANHVFLYENGKQCFAEGGDAMTAHVDAMGQPCRERYGCIRAYRTHRTETNRTSLGLLLPLPFSRSPLHHLLPQGDCKKRRLHNGHAGESSSRLPVEDLESMFSSLAIDNILSQGNSGDCCKNRKRKSCQEPAGDLISRFPGHLLEDKLSSLAMQDAAVTSSVCRQSGKQGSVLVFSDHNVFSKESSGCATPMICNDPDSRSSRSEEFIHRVNDRLLHHEGTGVQVFEVHFDLNSTHAAHLDKWVQFVSKSDAQCVRLHLCKGGISCSGHSVTASRYNFPLHCFDDGQASSLRKLSLTNCIFRPSSHSSSFSSLISLYLMRVPIADSKIQNIFSCCPVLRFLRLERCSRLVNARISSETLLHLDMYKGKKLQSIEIRSTSLVFFEYDGHKVDIKYASAPKLKRIVTKLSSRNSCLPKDLNRIKMIEKVTLTFLSPRKEPNFQLYAKKFTVLKFINLYILPSWNNVLAVAYLLQATPYVRRFRLEMQAYSGDQHHLDNGQVRWPEGISLQALHTILVGGFAAQPPLIELLACMVRAAPGLKLLTISPRYHLLKGLGIWARDDDGEKAARDHARSIARETVGLKLPIVCEVRPPLIRMACLGLKLV